MSSLLLTLVTSGGLIAVFTLMAAESCGVPFPSEVIMPIAGAVAAGALGGHISAPAAVLTGALGNLAGSLLAYLVAARWGEPLLLGPGRFIGIRKHHVDLADRWFQRHGLLAVFLGRMLPVIRTYISFPAGMAGVNLSRFALLTFGGALPWCAVLTAAGYAVGKNYGRVSRPIEFVAVVLALGVAGVVVTWLLRGRGPEGESVGGAPDRSG